MTENFKKTLALCFLVSSLLQITFSQNSLKKSELTSKVKSELVHIDTLVDVDPQKPCLYGIFELLLR